jgi:hypothetical protein
VTRRRFTVPTAILLTALLLATAFVIRLTQPNREDRQIVFLVNAGFEQPAEGRDLVLTVHDAYLADRVTSSTWVGDTEGIWLVVDATIGSKIELSTPYATLTVDGVQYTSSDRPDDAALGASVDAGLPQQGSFVFELPTSVLENPEATHARIRFATAFQVRFDSAIDLTLDLTGLRREKSATLQTPGVVLP